MLTSDNTTGSKMVYLLMLMNEAFIDMSRKLNIYSTKLFKEYVLEKVDE